MRRTPLLRRSALRSRTLKPGPKPALSDAQRAARDAWKAPKAGYCQCGCDRWTHHLEHHHVVERQTVVREGRPDLEWDPQNGIYLHPYCHGRHTSAMRRIALPSVPDAAVAFAVDLFGDELRAAQYLIRFYDTERL
jgi:hypothetical protein